MGIGVFCTKLQMETRSGRGASRDSRESRVQGQVFINVPADLPGARNGSARDVAAARGIGVGLKCLHVRA